MTGNRLRYPAFTSPSPLWAAARLPLLVYRALRWHALRGGWLGDHLRRRGWVTRPALPADGPIDVMVLVADHYEPARRHGDAAAEESVRSWCAEYELLAGPHRDADGRPPQHTWFYRYDYPNVGCLRELSASTFRGFGEVEFHLHHGHDTHDALAATFAAGLDWFGRFGAMRTAEARPRQRFGYVAGNSALDNGAGDDALSGCNTELRALGEAGCFADFTFPALGSPAQPRRTNAVYYAAEDGGPKSHDDGVEVVVGGEPSGDLMIFEGPLAIDWTNGCIEDGAIENSSPPHPRRLRAWLDGHVHVAGRPEWVFVKLHTHAMQNRKSFLSPANGAVFSAMEEWWNRPPFRLHYVTAREAYNIAKAAEAGHRGDPNGYRDYLVPRPANRVACCDVPWRLLTRTPERLHLEVLAPGPCRLELAEGPVQGVAGRLREIDVRHQHGRLLDLRVEAEGPYEVTYRGAEAAPEGACPAGRAACPVGR